MRSTQSNRMMLGPRALEVASVAAVIAAFLVLALAWARLVPVFQAPDEPAHFDYAVSIAHAHRLLRATEGPLASIADPSVLFLNHAVDADRIEFRAQERVRAGYGSGESFAKIDQQAPVVTPAFFNTPGHPLPWLITGYPYAFYTYIALVISAMQPFLGIAGLFFASRIACSLLVAGGLIFAYLSMRLLTFGRLKSIAVLAVMATLPLTVFVGSYVQPDNLSFLVMTAIFYFALRYKRDPASVPTLAALGVTVAIMAVTKIHMFAAVLIPVVGLVLTSVTRLPRERRPWGFIGFWMCVPAILTLAVEYGWVHPVGAHLTAITFGDMHANAILDAYDAGGFAAAFPLTWHWVTVAFNDFYGADGTTQLSYWGVFGWLDTPLVLHNMDTEGLFRRTIAIVNIVILFAMAVVVVRHLLACFSLVARGRRVAAVRLLFADPLTLTYAIFTTMLFILYTFSNNGFGAQGRDWFPFLLPAMVIAVDRAPHVFRNVRVYRAAGAFAAACLLFYALTGTYYASADVRDRYYGNIDPAKLLNSFASQWDGTMTTGSIDFVGSEVNNVSTSRQQTTVRGWAIDVQRKALARDIVVEIDGSRLYPAVYGVQRDDVAVAVGAPYKLSGFSMTLPIGALAPGHHRIAVRVVPSDFTYYERLSQTRDLLVTK